MEKFVLLLLLFVCVSSVGEWQEVSKNSEKVKSLAIVATKRISNGINSGFHQKVIEVLKAQRQLVSGFKYKLTISIGETTCGKGKISFEDAQKCDLQEKKHVQSCNVVMWEQSWLNSIKVLDFQCPERPALSEIIQRAVPTNDIVNLQRSLFENFVQKHQKTYSTEYEKEKRFKIFQVNLKKIQELNENEKGTATYGITKFADLNTREFKKYNLGLRPDLAQSNDVPVRAEIPEDPIPKSFDWREKNAVTGVKNQAECGSCWAFSTTGNIEGQWAINKKKLISLSEQELVDCDKVDQGCEGGLPSNAYKEIIRLGGLETEKEYPYEGEDEKCNFNKSEVRVYINSSVAISKNETKMAAWLVKNGPISIGINANAMQFYYGGISHPWKFLCSPDNLDHGVLIVGYGVHSYPLFKKTLPFWIIKNSWGASWGEQGYYRVYRGDGTCGLNLMATSAVVQ